jgi:hypothetical protein
VSLQNQQTKSVLVSADGKSLAQHAEPCIVANPSVQQSKNREQK